MQGAGKTGMGFKQVLLILKQVALHLRMGNPVLISSHALNACATQNAPAGRCHALHPGKRFERERHHSTALESNQQRQSSMQLPS